MLLTNARNQTESAKANEMYIIGLMVNDFVIANGIKEIDDCGFIHYNYELQTTLQWHNADNTTIIDVKSIDVVPYNNGNAREQFTTLINDILNNDGDKLYNNILDYQNLELSQARQLLDCLTKKITIKII